MPRLPAFLLLAALVLAGCGQEPRGPGGARVVDLPEPDGRSLGAIAQNEGDGPALVLTRAVSHLRPGKQRFTFQLSDVGGKQVEAAQVALYVAGVEADGQVGDNAAAGPWPVAVEDATTKPQFRSQTAAADPDTPQSFYIAEPHFPLGGKWAVMALARVGSRTVASDPVVVDVGLPDDPGPPAVGEPAVKVSTPTVASVGGDVAKIDTRTPPSSLHEDDLADVLGTKPVVLVFATPQLCMSKVCGPVVDVAEQVRAQAGDRVSFIHMEIYVDNVLSRGERPQVKAWKLPSEPWTFVIGSDGKVAARFEGIVSVRELQAAVDKVR